MAGSPLTPATFHILLALAEGPMHGFAVKRAVESRTGGAVRLGPGTLYAALARLADGGLVRAEPPARSAKPTSGPPAPVYAVTPAGRAALRAELDRLERDVKAGRAILSRAGRGGAR